MGLDTAGYGNAARAVSVSLALAGAAQDTRGAGSDVLGVDIESLLGGRYDDTLAGDAGANRLDGGSGDDALAGGGGNDTLAGGTGIDTLTGGAGSDLFVFVAGGGGDRVLDFAGGDLLLFSGFGAGYDSVGEILSTARQDVFGGVVETLIRVPNPGGAGTTSVVLVGVSLASLDAADFAPISR